MTNRINRQTEAFRDALWYCKHYGVDWREHIIPKVDKKEIVGYHVLDETFSTSIKTIQI